MDKIKQKIILCPPYLCGGATLSFVDFVGEFPYFRNEVLPRLKECHFHLILIDWREKAERGYLEAFTSQEKLCNPAQSPLKLSQI